MDELERRASVLVEADCLGGDLDDVVRRAGRIAARRRRRAVGVTLVAIVLVVAGSVAVARARTQPAVVLTAAQRQVVSCATVIDSGLSARSILVSLDPSAPSLAIDGVREQLVSSGVADVRVHTAEDNRRQLRSVLGTASPDAEATVVGASVTGTVPAAAAAEVDRILELARQRTGVTAASTGAVTCQVDDATARDLLDRYLRARWQGGADVVVQLAPTAAPGERDEVEAALRNDPTVRQAWAVSQQDAYAELTCRFATDPALLDAVRAEMLPWAYRVDLADGATVDAVRARFQARPGVVAVTEAPTLAQLAAPMDAASYTQLERGLDGASSCARPGRPLR